MPDGECVPKIVCGNGGGVCARRCAGDGFGTRPGRGYIGSGALNALERHWFKTTGCDSVYKVRIESLSGDGIGFHRYDSDVSGYRMDGTGARAVDAQVGNGGVGRSRLCETGCVCMDGTVSFEEPVILEAVDMVEHVADMLRDEDGGEGGYGRLRVCEAALRHAVDLLRAEVDQL